MAAGDGPGGGGDKGAPQCGDAMPAACGGECTDPEKTCTLIDTRDEYGFGMRLCTCVRSARDPGDPIPND